MSTPNVTSGGWLITISFNDLAQSTTASSTSSLLTVARRTTSRSRYVVFPSVANPSRCTAFFTSSERKLTLFVVRSSRTTRSVRRSRRPLTTASTSRYVRDVFSVFLLFPFVFADLSLPSLTSPHNRSRSLRRWAKSTAWRGSRLPSRCVFVPPCTRCISTFGKKPKHARVTRLTTYCHERDLHRPYASFKCTQGPPARHYSSSCPRGLGPSYPPPTQRRRRSTLPRSRPWSPSTAAPIRPSIRLSVARPLRVRQAGRHLFDTSGSERKTCSANLAHKTGLRGFSACLKAGTSTAHTASRTPRPPILGSSSHSLPSAPLISVRHFDRLARLWQELGEHIGI